MNPTAIILAGGKSQRMGEDKGLMELNGKPMIAHVLTTVSQLTDQIIIVANNPEYEKFGYPVYEDDLKDKGPLAGIVTGLSRSKSILNWVLSCDSPYLQENVLLELLNAIGDNDVVITENKGRIHPLIAVYQKSALKTLKEQLVLGNLKLMNAIVSLKVKKQNMNDFKEHQFKNLNSKKDL